MLPRGSRLRSTEKQFHQEMRQAAKLKSGLGRQRGDEASQSYRPELRDTATHSPRWGWTMMRGSLERPVSLLLCTSHIANLIDQLKATLQARFRVQWHVRRPAPEIAPLGATSQGTRQEPLSPQGSDSCRMQACCRPPG